MPAVNARAQDSLPGKQPLFDTAALLQQLNSLLDIDTTGLSASYTLVSAGVSNRLFSLHNNRLNAKQAGTSELVYMPSIGYFHKSGFSISGGVNFLHDDKKGFTANEYSVTPAFDFTGDENWAWGISYSKYFISDRFSMYASPVQNDWYACVSYKKHPIEPGLAIGYSTGNFTEINQATVAVTGNTFIDTGVYHLKSFSLAMSVSHDFKWDAVLGKSDAASFTPSLILNFAADTTAGVSHTIGQNLVRFLKRRGRILRLGSSGSGFGVQSVAASFGLNYSPGNFLIMPQLYLDYYLPATDEKRFTQTFAITVGYAF